VETQQSTVTAQHRDALNAVGMVCTTKPPKLLGEYNNKENNEK
jgi:hypothetical protein